MNTKKERSFSKASAALYLTEAEIKSLLDTADLLLRFRVCRGTLWKWRKILLLPYYRIGGRIYYKENELTEFLMKHRVVM